MDIDQVCPVTDRIPQSNRAIEYMKINFQAKKQASNVAI